MSARVEVVLSTYNGARHLPAQLDSILGQAGVDVRLTVRDDGSSDGTADVLAAYAAADQRVRVLPCRRAGLPAAYFELLDEVGTGPEYVALADQDDVWLPDKLRRAVDHLTARPDPDAPLLYCSRITVTDEQLSPLADTPLPRRPLDFANALTQNYATGCTIVLNRAARSVLLGRWPDHAVMHDAWLYLVVSGTGQIVYDPQPGVLYRQHSENAVGIGRSRLARVAGRVRRQLSRGGAGAHARQNAELARTHADLLRPDARRLLEEYLTARASRGARLVYALRGGAHRQSPGSDLVFRLLFAFGRS